MPLLADSLASYGVRLLGRQRIVLALSTAMQAVNANGITALSFATVAGSLALARNEVVRARLNGAQLNIAAQQTSVALESAGLIVAGVGGVEMFRPAIFGALTAFASGTFLSTDWVELRQQDIQALNQANGFNPGGTSFTLSVGAAVNNSSAVATTANLVAGSYIEVQRFAFDNYDLPDWNPQ